MKTTNVLLLMIVTANHNCKRMTALTMMNLRSHLSYIVRSLAEKASPQLEMQKLHLFKNPNNKSKNNIVGGSSEVVTAIMMGVMKSLSRLIAGYQ